MGKKHIEKRRSHGMDIDVDIPRGVLFHHAGSSGWGRIKNIDEYRGDKKEGDVSHLHDKFATEGEEA